MFRGSRRGGGRRSRLITLYCSCSALACCIFWFQTVSRSACCCSGHPSTATRHGVGCAEGIAFPSAPRASAAVHLPDLGVHDPPKRGARRKGVPARWHIENSALCGSTTTAGSRHKHTLRPARHHSGVCVAWLSGKAASPAGRKGCRRSAGVKGDDVATARRILCSRSRRAGS